MKLYGIPNCDTVAKARKYLSEKGHDFEFFDFRADGISPEALQQAFDALGAAVFNTRSPSWRNLSPDEQQALKSGTDLSPALESPTVIKRPLVFRDDDIFNGFKADDWQARGL